MKGEISIATTGLGDPAAFARVQAGTLAPDKALEEAYRRNNAGSYAEAAEFFAAASSGSSDAPLSRAEALVNEALQKSNLGRFAEADSCSPAPPSRSASDPIVARRLRNYRAIHDLNQGDAQGRAGRARQAAAQGRRSTAECDGTGKLEIDAAWPSASTPIPGSASSWRRRADELLPAEKAEILDGQALQLRGTSLRLTGDRAGAREALRRADGELLAVRGGKVASILWMRAQIFGDLGAIAEEIGRPGRGRPALPPGGRLCSRPIIRAPRSC